MKRARSEERRVGKECCQLATVINRTIIDSNARCFNCDIEASSRTKTLTAHRYFPHLESSLPNPTTRREMATDYLQNAECNEQQLLSPSFFVCGLLRDDS